MSALFPLPAVIFLCCLLLLLVVLAILYFVLKSKNNLCTDFLTGHHDPNDHDGEDGQPLLRNHDGDVPTANKGENPSTSGNPPIVTTPIDSSTIPGDGVTNGHVPRAQTENPGHSTLNLDVTDGDGGGTPLSSALPPPTTLHVPDTSPVADKSGESGNGDVAFYEAEEEPLCRGGKMMLSFVYITGANKLNMTVKRAIELPSVEVGGSENVVVHICVLPMRKQRFKTKQVAVAESQAIFNQTFNFVHMTSDLLDKCAIRLRVYGAKKFSKRLIGEANVVVSKIDLTSALADNDIWRNINPKGMVAQFYGIDEEDEVDDTDDWAD